MKNTHTHKINEPLQGTVGESHLWDGPLDTSRFPMGKGSSSGKDGLEVSKYACKPYSFEPITQRAKGQM